MALQISKISHADIDAYLEAKVRDFAVDESAYPEKLGWLEGLFSNVLNGHTTLESVRNEIRKAVAQ